MKLKKIKEPNANEIKSIERRSRLVSNNYNLLKDKTVAIIGVGGTGNLVASLLARAGIGKLILIDKDVVEESNLERQMLFDFDDIGKNKSEVVKTKLSKFCIIVFHDCELNSDNIDKLELQSCDLILDCTDNMETRHTINKFCVENKVPFIYTGAIQNSGVVYFVNTLDKKSPCLNCFLNQKFGKKAKEAGVINAAVTTVSSIAASIAYNYLCFDKIEKDLIRINLDTNEFLKLSVKKNKSCNICK